MSDGIILAGKIFCYCNITIFLLVVENRCEIVEIFGTDHFKKGSEMQKSFELNPQIEDGSFEIAEISVIYPVS